MTKHLTEGLKVKDLEDVVLTTISIDEYESKIDDEKAIVVTFFVIDKQAAKDLAKFIERSAIDFLDAEASPAPDLDGNYLVFVEVKRNDEFVKNIIRLCKTLKGLTSIEKFKFKVYKKKGEYDLTEDNLKKRVRLTPKDEQPDHQELSVEDIETDAAETEKKKVKQKTKEAIILSYLKNSMLENAAMENGNLALTKFGKTRKFQVLDFGDDLSILEQNNLNALPINYGLDSFKLTESINNYLGPNWTILSISDCLVIKNNNSNNALLVKEVF
jgi:hypothetical protein